MKVNTKTERRDGQSLRHQSAVGLLLLTLLMANPLQGFATPGYGVIGASTNDVNLTNFFGLSYNSVLVTNGITITGTNNAIFGNTQAWYLTNAATLNGNTNGILLNSGGSVNNLTNGTINGGANGVEITGGTNGMGSVVNAGLITGTNGDGVYMDTTATNGSVNNLAGTITGGTNGVEIAGAGAVTNTGSITGHLRDGVYLSGGGSVTNGGTIAGLTNGVEITGGTSSVVNAGSIIGTNRDGVYMGTTATNGSVNNLAGGTITGGTNGVEFAAAGSVTNTGTITGYYRDGVYMGTNGSVNNLAGGITGGANGVEIAGTGSVVNAGSIIGTNGNGVYMGAGGNVTMTNQGHGLTIWGGQYGVYITGGMGSVTNYRSSIMGVTNDGVRLQGGGTVDNEQGGIIGGNTNGVSITGGAGTVINGVNSTITGTNGDGVYMGTNGSVVNNQNGLIKGGQYGVAIAGTGSVVNAGLITGTTNDGVYMGAGGSVYNQLGGSIQGTNGVYITGGAGYVTNAGTIIGSGGTAIGLGYSNAVVVLQTGSIVQGNIVGVASTNNAAFLQGYGSYSNNFVNFQTLTVQADPWLTGGYTNDGWNLTGTNTFSTNTTVQTGLLRINGILTSPLVTVSNGAGLGGAGTIISSMVNVNNQGFILPGNSLSPIGTLTIVGALNMMTNSIYYENVNAAGQSASINVTTNGSGLLGTAIISNATVVVEASHSGIYAAQTVYTNLTATGGVLGTNAGISIQGTPLFLTPSLQYLTNTLGTTNTTVTTTLSRKSFTTVASTYNQSSVAGALYGIVDSHGAMSNLVNEFFWLPDAGTARAELDSLSGAIHGSLGMLDVQQQDAFNNSIALRTGRISAGGESGGYTSAKPVQLASADSTLPPMQSSADQLLGNIWLQGFGSFGHLDGDGNALGGDYTISGTSGGLDYRLSPEILVGLAVGYSHNDASVGGPGASGSVDAIQFAGYGGYVSGPWHLDGIFSYGYLQTDTKRIISVGSINPEADGSYDGNVFSLSTEGGYAFEAGPLTIEPTLGLNYTHLSQDSFNETGAGVYGLSVHSVDMDSFRSAVGVRLAAKFGEKDDVQFIPELRAGWEHEFLDRTADVNASFIGGSGDFVVRGVELGADSGVLGAGLTVWFNKAIQGFVNYDARMNERISSHTISGGLSYSW